MKKIYLSISILITIALFFSCQEEDQDFGDFKVPSNIEYSFDIIGQDDLNPNGDGSGKVDFKVTADNTITYQFNFGDGSNLEAVTSGEISHRFSVTGTNSYTVTVIASGQGGLKTSTAFNIIVFSAFDDQPAKDFLSGGVNSSKVWYLAASETRHLGVGPTLDFDIQINGGPSQYYYPAFDSTAPFDKCNDPISDCLCDDELTFEQDSNSQLTFQLNNNGQTFFNAAHQLGVLGEEAGEDNCYDFDTSGISNVSFAPSDVDWSLIDWTGVPDFNGNAPRATVMNFTNNAFMGYYVGSSTYEILEITNDYLHVRTIDAINPVIVWYHKYSTTNPNALTGDCSGETGNTASGNNDVLVWADEFDEDGAPCSDNWTYDLGDGCPSLCGWGNNESEYYTDRSDNVKVEDGVLKITAKKETFMGSDYTSARLKSEGLFEFQYGRIEVRAKLPTGGGTWPAIWMLGDTSQASTWPEIGEIDIMEHAGNSQNTIHGTLHYPGNSGGNANGNTTVVQNVSTEFKVYEVEWNASTINFIADGVTFHTVANNSSIPFNHNFYFMINVAMGGSFGGGIDPSFTESTMEIDYIRVYQ
jgi:hypothetical protein